jgi:molybdopterin synthase catalytic subunit
MGAETMDFQLTDQPIDAVSLKDELRSDRAGACVCFEGWVRNHNEGREVTALEYEAHDSIAAKEGEKILGEARERFALTGLLCRHRVGRLRIGECAVWIGVAADHRGTAFDACRYIIDEIKHRLPVWKKEHYEGGASGWVNCAQPAETNEDRRASGS